MGLFKPNVKKLLTNRDVPGLTNALKHNDWKVRRDAAAALGVLRDPLAVEALLVTLNDADVEVSVAAAVALGQIGDERAVDPLIGALKGKPPMRRAAIKALGKIGDASAVEPLIAMLEPHHEPMCEDAAVALGEIGDQRAIPFLLAAIKDKKYHHEGFIKLACYLAVKRISDEDVSAEHTRILAEALASEIFHLYSRTESIRWGEFVWGEGAEPDVKRVTRMGNWASPDVDSIRALAEQMPDALRDQVRALVRDECKGLI
jgi:HEAT repeat protein